MRKNDNYFKVSLEENIKNELNENLPFLASTQRFPVVFTEFVFKNLTDMEYELQATHLLQD